MNTPGTQQSHCNSQQTGPWRRGGPGTCLSLSRRLRLLWVSWIKVPWLCIVLKQETKVGAEGFDVRLDCQYNIQTVLVCLRDEGDWGKGRCTRRFCLIDFPSAPSAWLIAPEVFTSDMLWRSRNHILGASNAEGCKVHRSYIIQHHRRGVSQCRHVISNPQVNKISQLRFSWINHWKYRGPTIFSRIWTWKRFCTFA